VRDCARCARAIKTIGHNRRGVIERGRGERRAEGAGGGARGEGRTSQ